MQKHFVIDTNVLLHDPSAVREFPNSHVVIPLNVLEELDRMKRLPDELGRNARRVFELLESFRKIGEGSLHEGIALDNGATLSIQLQIKTGLSKDLALSITHHRILMAALYLQEQGKRVVFVSKDFAARVKAEALGLGAEDYERLKYAYDSLYRGIRQVAVTKRQVDEFLKDREVSLDGGEEWHPNEYCVMTSPENSSAIGKFDRQLNRLIPLIKMPNIWGIKPRNVEQRCSIDALLNDTIKLVTLMGPAGTGKTLLALACALRKVFDEGNYARILVSRPVVPLGRDIGYLPGTKEEKLFHWMQPIYDNLELLCETTDKETSHETLNWVMDSNKIEMEAVTFIRGRSLPNVFMIIDEAQNLTPHEMKTIISRAGEGTKVVLTGDPTQIDNPYLDRDSNGLTYTVGRFSQEPIYGHLFLEKTERSQLAALAAEIL
ncbi:MAG: PhoH family protein [Waddliaceae bacterium]